MIVGLIERVFIKMLIIMRMIILVLVFMTIDRR